jgi:hypothetical protein
LGFWSFYFIILFFKAPILDVGLALVGTPHKFLINQNRLKYGAGTRAECKAIFPKKN